MTDDSRTGRRSILPLVIGLPLIAVVAAVALFLTYSGDGDRTAQAPSGGGSEEQSAPDEQTASPSTTTPENDTEEAGLGTPTLGRADAPVVMMEFSDYQ